MRWLAIILFVPRFAILPWAYWNFPKSLPRTSSRRTFDLVVIVVTLLASLAAMLISHYLSDGIAASIWKQVAASTGIYIAFLGALLIAVLVRRRLFAGNASRP